MILRHSQLNHDHNRVMYTLLDNQLNTKIIEH
jgi:hypothetical protein